MIILLYETQNSVLLTTDKGGIWQFNTPYTKAEKAAIRQGKRNANK